MDQTIVTGIEFKRGPEVNLAIEPPGTTVTIRGAHLLLTVRMRRSLLVGEHESSNDYLNGQVRRSFTVYAGAIHRKCFFTMNHPEIDIVRLESQRRMNSREGKGKDPEGDLGKGSRKGKGPQREREPQPEEYQLTYDESMFTRRERAFIQCCRYYVTDPRVGRDNTGCTKGFQCTWLHAHNINLPDCRGSDYPYILIPPKPERQKGEGKRKGKEFDSDEMDIEGTDPGGPRLGRVDLQPREPRVVRPRAINPAARDYRRYDWADCHQEPNGTWIWTDPVSRLRSVILEEDIIKPQTAAGIRNDRRDGGVVEHFTFPGQTVPDMPDTWAAWNAFKERMARADMKIPAEPQSLKDMKILRDRIYPVLFDLEKEAINDHERKMRDIQTQKSPYQPSTSDERKRTNYSSQPEGWTMTEAMLWKQAYERTSNMDDCKQRFE